MCKLQPTPTPSCLPSHVVSGGGGRECVRQCRAWSPNLFLPGVWSLLGTQPCCHQPQPEEPSLEQAPLLEMPQLLQTPLLDLVPPHVITHLCELYGVQKLRTSPYHAQTNGQVERMNQMIICMIGKLEEDRKACWSEHLPELLLAYNATRSAVTGYSPYYLLFGRRPRIPVDYLFPTLCDSPHQTKMEVSVVAMQKRLKEAFTVARHLTSEEVARQCRYYDRKAGAVALQPGDIVMVHTDGFVGWRTGLSTRSNVQLLMTGRNLNTRFSIETTYCSSSMRMPLASQVKHRPRQPQLSRMPHQRLFQQEQVH